MTKSIRENIIFYRPENDKQLLQAIEFANLTEDIEGFALIEVGLLLAIHSLVFTSGAQASWKFSCLSSQLRSGRVSRPQQE